MATSQRGLPTITLQDPPPQGEVSGRIPIGDLGPANNSIIARIEYRAMIDYASGIRAGGHLIGGEGRIGDPSAGPDVAPKQPGAKA